MLRENIEYVYMPALSQIESDLTQRSNSDLMNNYFIEIVARSFTRIEETLMQKFENEEALRQKATLKELSVLQPMWQDQIEQILVSINQQMDHKN